jgi:hypothetical protein
MSSSGWACLACGNSNSFSINICQSCQCPSPCSVVQIKRHRASYLNSNKALGPSVGLHRDSEDTDVLKFIVQVLVSPFVGWWLVRPKSSEKKNELM